MLICFQIWLWDCYCSDGQGRRGFSSENPWSLPTLMSSCWGDEKLQIFRAYNNSVHFLVTRLWIAVAQLGSAPDSRSEIGHSMYLLFQVKLKKKQPPGPVLLMVGSYVRVRIYRYINSLAYLWHKSGPLWTGQSKGVGKFIPYPEQRKGKMKIQ